LITASRTAPPTVAYTLDILTSRLNLKLWVYPAEKMHMIGHMLHSHDVRIVFCCHLAFLVLAYLPMPKGRGLTLDLGNVNG
jgi:hypothetical protein